MTTPTDPFPANPQFEFTPFLPSTYNIPAEDDRMKPYLMDNLCIFSDIINDKKIGTIVQGAENFNGEKWFYKTTQVTRNGYQTLVYVPSWVPGTLTLTTPPPLTFPIQDIDPNFVVTLVYGSASLAPTITGAGNGDYFSFFGSGNAKIQFTMSDIQIVITTNGTTAAYSGFIVINYLRNGL
jgi:hypothetical protein